MKSLSSKKIAPDVEKSLNDKLKAHFDTIMNVPIPDINVGTTI